MDVVNKKFLDLYNSYSNDVLRLAFSFTKNIYEAEDIVQSVFIKLYKELEKNSHKTFNKEWLLKVVVNECKNNFKLAWRKKIILQEEIIDCNFNLYETLKNDDLSEALLNLPLKYRKVIYLYYYEDYKIDEIAKILGWNSSNVKTLLSRGRQKLKKLLEENRK